MTFLHLDSFIIFTNSAQFEAVSSNSEQFWAAEFRLETLTFPGNLLQSLKEKDLLQLTSNPHL